MKVKTQFFCTKEKKIYYIGDEYTGERKDLSHLMQEELEDKAFPKKKIINKRKK